MSFLSAVLTMELAVPNSTLNTTPINAVPAANTLAATTVYYNPAFQVGIGPTTIPLPNSTTMIAYVKNLDPTNNLTVSVTPLSQTMTSFLLPPGAVFLYFVPSEVAGGGITALSAQAAGATINAEVFLGF